MRKNRSKIFITSALLIMGLAACGKSDDKSDKSTSENTDISTELSTDDTGSTAASSTESGSTTETDSTTEQGSTTETGSTTTEASSTLTPAGIGITTEVIDNTSTTTEANGFPNGFSMDNIDGLGGLTTQDPNQGNGPSSVNEEICNAYIDVLKKNEDAINAYNFQYSYTVYDEIVPEDKSSTPVAFADVNGSGVRDMLFMTAENEYSARLNIYTFFDSDAYEIYNEYLDVQVGGAASYCLFTLKDNDNLFIYRSYGDQNWTDSIMELSFATYPFTKVHEWSVVRTYDEQIDSVDILCYIDGNQVTQNELMNASIDIYDNIDEILMYNGALTDSELVDMIRSGNHSALSLNNAIAMLETGGASQNGNFVDPNGNGGNDETDPNSSNQNQSVDAADALKDIPIMYFSSGAGGWATVIEIADDGSFIGEYYDSNYGETGDGYENGTFYICEFTGKFTDVQKVADYTYTMKISNLTMTYDAGQEWIESGMRFVASPPYGIETDPDTVYTLYLPGAKTSSMSDSFLSWVASPMGMATSEIPDPFPYYGIYNPVSETGFWGVSE